MTDPETRRIYEAARIGGPLNLGRRPGVLVVDLQRGFTAPDGPVGSDLTEPVEATRRLLDVARTNRQPIVFTVIGYGADAEAGVWGKKMPGLLELRTGGPWTELDPRLAARPDEPVILKRGASALFGTNVASMFTAQRCDTVVVCGATTSGCVRASVVDLMQAGFPVLVAADCCGDRARGPHDANLFDMAAKYADVASGATAAEYLTWAAESASPGRPARVPWSVT